MAVQPKVRVFAGDIRMWVISGLNKLPVISVTDDISGNQPIEAESCTFSYTEGDKTEIKSKRRGTRYGQPIYSETQPGTTQVKIVLREQPPLILASILFGEGSGATLAAGAVVDQPFNVTEKGFPLQLPHRLLKSVPVPVVKLATETLVAGTDYDLDLRRGIIVVKSADVDEADELNLSYSYEAQVGLHIVGGATPTRPFFISGDMEDRRSGENGELRIPQANLRADGDIDWLSSEPISATLTGDVIVAANESAPYTFDTYQQVA